MVTVSLHGYQPVGLNSGPILRRASSTPWSTMSPLLARTSRRLSHVLCSTELSRLPSLGPRRMRSSRSMASRFRLFSSPLSRLWRKRARFEGEEGWPRSCVLDSPSSSLPVEPARRSSSGAKRRRVLSWDADRRPTTALADACVVSSPQNKMAATIGNVTIP